MQSRHVMFIAIIAMITLSLSCAHPGSESAERVGETSDQSVEEHPADEQSLEAEPEPLEPDAFVLRYSDARFYETPAADERAHRVFDRSREQARQQFVNLFHGRVVEDLGEWVEIRSGDLAFTVELPDDAVGRSFSQYIEPGEEREFVAKALLDAGWYVGSTTLIFREQRRAGDLVYTEGMSTKGEDILLTLERRCSRITAMVESAIKVEPDEPKVRVAPAQEEQFPYYAVDGGTIVY